MRLVVLESSHVRRISMAAFWRMLSFHVGRNKGERQDFASSEISVIRYHGPNRPTK